MKPHGKAETYRNNWYYKIEETLRLAKSSGADDPETVKAYMEAKNLWEDCEAELKAEWENTPDRRVPMPTVHECVHEINTKSVDTLHSDIANDHETLLDELKFIAEYARYAIVQLGDKVRADKQDALDKFDLGIVTHDYVKSECGCWGPSCQSLTPATPRSAVVHPEHAKWHEEKEAARP